LIQQRSALHEELQGLGGDDARKFMRALNY
jgi:hypothetical protein